MLASNPERSSTILSGMEDDTVAMRRTLRKNLLPITAFF
jgi:hypothetical protein